MPVGQPKKLDAVSTLGKKISRKFSVMRLQGISAIESDELREYVKSGTLFHDSFISLYSTNRMQKSSASSRLSYKSGYDYESLLALNFWNTGILRKRLAALALISSKSGCKVSGFGTPRREGDTRFRHITMHI